MEWIQFIQEAEAWLQPIPIQIRGSRLSDSDERTWKTALILQSLFIPDICEHSHLRTPQQMKQWLLVIASYDVGCLGTMMKDAALMVRHYPSRWNFLSFTQFKAELGHDEFGSFISPIKDIFIRYLSCPCADDLRVILQWLVFLTRITLKTAFTPDSSEFEAIESKLGQLKQSSVWDDLRRILFPIASSFRPYSYFPTLSNGANANSPRGVGKWGKLAYGWGFSDDQRYLLSQWGYPTHPSEYLPEEELAARVVFVPKGIDSRRTICEEPVGAMFLQQAIHQNMADWFTHESRISRHINLENQDIQRQTAQNASSTLTQATLDLSAASDSVSYALCEYVFGGSVLWNDLSNSRSKLTTLPDGRTLSLNKFAPMGSAVNFPVECLIFLGICLLGCETVRCAPQVRVYGDDLIVPGKAEDCISTLLSQFGFTLNEKKSFWYHERFKESCGGEYLDGTDVSPLYISRRFSMDPHQTTNQETWTMLANDLYKRHFKHSRRFLISSCILRHYPGTAFCADPNLGLFSPEATNFHLEKRWNKFLQTYELRSQSNVDCGPIVADDDTFYELYLIQSMRSPHKPLLYPEDKVSVDRSLPLVQPKWRWSIDHFSK